MKKLLVISFFTLCLLLIVNLSNSQVIISIASNPNYGLYGYGYSGDGGPATNAEMHSPFSGVFDTFGNLFIADYGNNVIREVNTSGIISTIVGNGFNHGTGNGGYSGDGGPATNAELYGPISVTFDGSGNLFIAEGNNNVIREVNTLGIISTFAGNYSYGGGYSGDGGSATAAEIYNPTGVAFDSSGDLIIADNGNNIIRKVNTSGIISTIAGNHYYGLGYSGNGGPATNAELDQPWGVTFDAYGNFYIADSRNEIIREVNTSGIISTIAGIAENRSYGGDGGPASNAELYNPYGVTFDAYGNLYIADGGNNVIREVNSLGIISTIAGDYSYGGGYSGDGGPATNAELYHPAAITLDVSGNIFIVDTWNNAVRGLKDLVTGINTGVNDRLILTVFPNPNNGSFSFSLLNINEKCSIEVYNVLGEKVYDTPTLLPQSGGGASFSYQINISSQPNGVYLYRVVAENGELIGEGKLVVEH